MLSLRRRVRWWRPLHLRLTAAVGTFSVHLAAVDQEAVVNGAAAPNDASAASTAEGRVAEGTIEYVVKSAMSVHKSHY